MCMWMYVCKQQRMHLDVLLMWCLQPTPRAATHPATSGSWPCTLKGEVKVGWPAQAKLDMVAKPLRAGRIRRGLFSVLARDLTLLMADASSAVVSGVIKTLAAHVTCSCGHSRAAAATVQGLLSKLVEGCMTGSLPHVH
jgi:hypothetical protein